MLARALRTLEIWRTGDENGKASRSEKEAVSAFFGKGVLSRIPKPWWGNGGERVLVLMLQERRKLLRKRSAHEFLCQENSITWNRNIPISSKTIS